MDTWIAYCGLNCRSCLVRLAAIEEDRLKKRILREQVSEECARLYGMQFDPEEISDCDGCRSKSGRLFPGCKNCDIRNCAQKLNVESCAFCERYPCELLYSQFLKEPETRTRLERIRRSN